MAATKFETKTHINTVEAKEPKIDWSKVVTDVSLFPVNNTIIKASGTVTLLDCIKVKVTVKSGKFGDYVDFESKSYEKDGKTMYVKSVEFPLEWKKEKTNFDKYILSHKLLESKAKTSVTTKAGSEDDLPF